MTARSILPAPDFSDYPKTIIEFCGAQYLGVQQSPLAGDRLHLFTDPQTGTTLAILENEITIARVQERLSRARAAFTERAA
jgi:hypothetical protein